MKGREHAYVQSPTVVHVQSLFCISWAVLVVQIHPGIVNEHVDLTVVGISPNVVGESPHTLRIGNVQRWIADVDTARMWCAQLEVISPTGGGPEGQWA